MSNCPVERPVSVDPDVAVASEQFEKISARAVALSVTDSSAATMNNWLGLSATKALTGKFVSTLTLLAPGQ